LSVLAEPRAEVEADPAAPVAVIDIGSNSVRLVVYEGGRRAPLTHYNEKAICALGGELARTGRLGDAAVDETLALLRRFRLLAEQMGASPVHAVATAAVRAAGNGPAFVALAERALSAPVRVLSGTEEARLAAIGVLAGMPGADGIVGDLGGGSLELVDVAGGRAGEGETAPIGTLVLGEGAARPRDAVKIVDEALSAMRLPRRARGRALHLVGGTWRAIARVDMERRDYPLHIIDRYTLDPREALKIARLMRGLSPASLRAMPSVSGARIATIAYGALVLERLIGLGEPSAIIFSAHGLREGIMHSMLPGPIAAEEPLLASVRAIAAHNARSPGHGPELARWTEPLFGLGDDPESPEQRRLREAACHLGDIAWRAHPDYRGRRSIDIVVHGNLAGIDHPGRAFLALASYFCHANRIRDPAAQALTALVDKSEVARARVLGSAIRLSQALTGAWEGVLARCPLDLNEREVVVRVPADLADMVGGAFNRRLARLAGIMDREGRAEVMG
jgi:exopolyphosphatase/guanosine-5'-triphosphate,3'-diphosphate pyrophosphatase